MSPDRLDFDVVDLNVDIVETVPIKWQGREVDSGPIHISLSGPGSRGVIDYDAGTVEVEFRSKVEFPELAETLEDLGADEALYEPVAMVIRSQGAVLDGHYLRLAGIGKINAHRLFDPSQTRIDIHAPSQCKPDAGAGTEAEIKQALRDGIPVSWNFNPAEKRVEIQLPKSLGGETHQVCLSGSYTLAAAKPEADTARR